MTYNFTRNAIDGTNLRFTRNTSDLPLDKLRCFWRLSGNGAVALDSLGTMNLTIDGGGAGASAPTRTSAFIDLSASRPDGAGYSPNWASQDASYNSSFESDWLARGTTPFAFTGWIRTPDATRNQMIVTQYTSDGGHDRGLVIDLSAPGTTARTLSCRWWYNNASADVDTVTTTDTVSDDAWTFFAGGSDGTNYWALINAGTAVTTSITGSGLRALGDHPLRIGRIAVNSSDAFGGEICDVAYWYNQGLFTAGQLADLYNGGNGNTLLRG